MINEFSVGDTVRLISGGPLMTVNDYNDEKDLVDCIWFNMDEILCSGTFKGAVVMIDVDDFDFDDFDFDEEEDDEEWEEELDEEELDEEELDEEEEK